jgi:hypothetical protein
MTVAQLKAKFPQDLINSLTESDDSIITTLITEAETFINSIIAITDATLKEIHETSYVIYRLYERHGYEEQAQAYYDRLMNALKRTTGLDTAAPSAQHYITAGTQVFTTTVLDKW